VGGLFASVIATATIAVILNEIDGERGILAGQAYRRVFRRLRSLAGGMLTEIIMVFLLTITVVGIPFAVHRFVRWSLFAQACMLDDLSSAESLRRSSELVRGHWWRTFGFTVLVDVLAVLSGPLLGVALLLLTDRSLSFINLAGALVYTFTVPFAPSSSRSTTSTWKHGAAAKRARPEAVRREGKRPIDLRPRVYAWPPSPVSSAR
jgi:hypothetical protein